MKKPYQRLLLWMTTLLVLVSAAACGQKTQDTQAKAIDLGSLTETLGSLKDASGAQIFDGLEQLTSGQLSDLYGIDLSLCDDSFAGFDKNYGLVLVLRPGEGKSNDVKNNVNTAMGNLATQLALYSPEQSALVENRMETKRGDFLIYIACGDNDTVLAEIEKSMI